MNSIGILVMGKTVMAFQANCMHPGDKAGRVTVKSRSLRLPA